MHDILRCDHSHESSSAMLPNDAVCAAIFYITEFGIFFSKFAFKRSWHQKLTMMLEVTLSFSYYQFYFPPKRFLTYHNWNPGQMKCQSQHADHFGKVPFCSEPSVVKGKSSRYTARWHKRIVAERITRTTETA